MISRQRGSRTNPFSRILSKLRSGDATPGRTANRRADRARRATQVNTATSLESLETRALLSALTVSADDTRALSFSLDATDEADPITDILTINDNITVESVAGTVTLNVGDNLITGIGSTVAGATGVVINLDQGAADPGAGGNLLLAGGFTVGAGEEVSILGGNDDDSFGLQPASFLDAPLSIDGGGGTNNILEFDLTGVTDPVLTYTDENSGVLTSTSHADVDFDNIQDVQIFGGSGTDLTVELDLSGLATGDDGNADTIVVQSGGANSVQVLVNTVQLWDLNPGDFNDLVIGGTSDDETLMVDHTAGTITVPISFDGEGGTNELSLIGDGTLPGNYSPDGTVEGSGTVEVDGDTVTFSDVDGVDVSGLTDAEIILPNAADVIDVDAGVDFATGLIDALLLSGSSGVVDFATVAFYDNTTMAISTGDVDGVDAIDINSADNAHGNLSVGFNTGGTGSDGDVIRLNGDVTTEAVHFFRGAAVQLTTDVVLTSTDTGNISFLDASVDGANSLTVNTQGVTILNAVVGGMTPLTSLTTDAGGGTTIGQTEITTTGDQNYHDDVTLAADVTLDAATVVLHEDLDASPNGFQTLFIAGDLITGDGVGDTIGGTNPLGSFEVSGTTTFQSTPAAGATVVVSDGGADSGALIFNGPVVLATAADVSLQVIGDGVTTFNSTVDGAQALTVDSGDDVNFNAVVGGTTPLSSLSVTTVDDILVGANVTTSAAQSYEGRTIISPGATLSGSEVSFANDLVIADGTVDVLPIVGDVTIGNAATDELVFDINGLTTPGADFDQLQVTGTVTLGGSLDLDDAALTATGSIGDSMVLISNDGTDAVVGTFNGLPNGSLVTLNGQQWRILYDGGDGNDVELRFGQAMVSVGDAQVTEGDADTSTITFNVTVDTPSAGAFRVTYGTGDETATAGSGDFTAATGTLNFGGLTYDETQTVSITVAGDEVVELTETFTLSLIQILDTTNVAFADSQATGTITNDDSATINIAGVSQFEGNTGTTQFVFDVTLDSAVDTSVGVTYETVDDSANAGPDFVAASDSLSFPGTLASETQQISVTVQSDTVPELDEQFFVNLLTISDSGRNVTLGDSSAIGTILDDDRIAVDISVAPGSVEEGNDVVITATAASVVTADETFVIDVSGLGITSTDYTLPTATVTILMGQTEGTVTLTIEDDTLVEATETATVALTTPSAGVRLGTTSSQDVTITDNDAATLAIVDQAVVETDGVTSIVFSVTSSGTVDAPYTVDFATADGTATTTDGDYTQQNDQLTFPGADNQTQTITIAVAGDEVVELDETFLVNLSNVLSNGRSVSLSTSSATGTITNDDAATISIGNVTADEGDSGNTTFTFDVTLTNAVDTGFTVGATTEDNTATTSDTDYVPLANGVVTFTGTAGETAMVSVTVNGDAKVEGTESFFLNLGDIAANGRNVTVLGAQGVGTITNDDTPTPVNLSVSTSAASESGATVVTVTATTDAIVVGDQTLDVAVAGIAASDYDLSGTTLTIADGAMTGVVTFTVVDDAVVEALETATISISNPSFGIALGATTSAEVTIADNDSATISINDVTADEGDSGDTMFTFTVSLSNEVDVGVSLDYDSTNGTASADNGDYASVSGTLNFPANSTDTQTITVLVTGDELVELDENFLIDLTGLSTLGRTVSFQDNQGRGTITNDDSATLSINDVPTIEGDAGTTIFTFLVTLDAAVDAPFTVDYSTSDGTANAGSDYTAISGNSVAFSGAAGEMRPLQVVVTADGTAEADETFFVTLSNILANNRSLTLADAQGLGTILDDDGIPVNLSADLSAGTEADTTVITLTATADSAVVTSQTLDLTVTGTNVTDSDYVLSAQTITIDPGETQGSVTFTVQNDDLVELAEIATVTISNPSVGIALGTTVSQNITINNSSAATLSIGDATAAETDSGDTVFQFTVTLDADVDGPVTVAYTTVDGTATAGSDFTAISGTLMFDGTANETKTIDVMVTGDQLVELNESFTVALSAVDAGGRPVTLSGDPGLGTITNDDTAEISITDVTASETDVGTTFTFTVSVGNAVDSAFSVDYATADGTATVADNDYTAVSATTLNFTGTAGESFPVQVSVTGDTVAEADEQFFVILSNIISNDRDVVSTDNTGFGTITDDDGIMVELGSIIDAGTEAAGTEITLVVTADEPVSGNQTVDLQVGGAGITEDDYSLPLTTITILDGQTVGSAVFTVLDDSVVEGIENAIVTISNPSTGISLGGVVTQSLEITSNDSATISIADGSVLEGNSGTTTLELQVTSDNAVQGGFTVDFATSDGTADGSTDYVADSGTLNFTGAGNETQTVTIVVNGDTDSETDETVLVTLSNLVANGVPVTIANADGVGTITNDDVSTGVNISLDVNSGTEADQTAIVITATADAAVVGDQTVDVTITGTDVDTDDYGISTTTITILNGETTGSATLTIADDGLLEASLETATVTLTNPSAGLTIGGTPSASFTIQDSSIVTLDPIDQFPGNRPELTWQAVPGAVRYEMWFSRVFPNVGRIYSDTNITTTSWTPPADLDPAFYRYWVRGFDVEGNPTAWSLENVFDVNPTLVSPLRGSFAPRPTFEWEPVPFASGYTLFLRSDDGDQVIEDIPDATYTPTTDLPSGEVLWWIRASEAIGNRGWSFEAIAGGTPQAVVTGPVGSTTDTTPTITWGEIQGTTRYALFVLNTDTNEVEFEAYFLDGNQPSYTLTNELSFGNYRVWVKAIGGPDDSFGSGFWSRPVDFSVSANTNDHLTTEDEDDSTLTVFADFERQLAAQVDPPVVVHTQRVAETPIAAAAALPQVERVTATTPTAASVFDDAEFSLLDLLMAEPFLMESISDGGVS